MLRADFGERKMSKTTILRIDDLNVHARGDGVETTLLAGKHVCGSRITTGFTSFPPGKEVPVHKHNCDEQVTLIEGEAVVETPSCSANMSNSSSDATTSRASYWPIFRHLAHSTMLQF